MGDSFMRRRMYSDTPTRKIEMMNGTRQPHELNVWGVIAFWTRILTSSEANSPSVAVI